MANNNRNRRGSELITQLAIAVIPAVITAYFGYKTALDQARVNTDNRTGATYDSLKGTVDDLGTAVTNHNTDLAALKQQVDDMQRQISQLHPATPPRPAVKLSTPVILRKLPRNLNDAIGKPPR